MKRRAIIRSAAREDILRQFRYYLVEEDNPELADRFLTAAEVTVDKVCASPAMGAPKHFPNKALRGLRSWPIVGFEDIRIYYLASAETLLIVRVLHGKRDLLRMLRRERLEKEEGL